jgi:hypothetical protein
VTFWAMAMNQTATFSLSSLMGRLSLTLVNFRRVGSWWT